MPSHDFHRINSDIVSLVHDDRVRDRVECMGKVADELVTAITDLPDTNCIFLNVALLTSAVRSYFIDVERYKNFHDISLVDRSKVSSYSVKWILKYKPIQFKIDNPDEFYNPALLALNEHFALKWGLATSKIDAKNLKPEILDEILYTFQYRNVDESNLTLIFKSLGGSDLLESG